LHWNVRACFIVSVGTGLPKPVNLIEKQTSGPSNNSTGRKSNSVGSNERHEKLPNAALNAARNPQPVNVRRRTQSAASTELSSHLVKSLIELSTSSESTHLRVWSEAHAQDELVQFPYYRFNVQRGMDEVSHEEWKLVEVIADMTRSYLNLPDIKQELEKCAKGLENPDVLPGT
jgi:hypothetical protein